MHTPGGGEKKGNFAFRFLRAKKKRVPRMLFTRGLAHSQVYREGEREKGLPFEPFDQSGRGTERPSRYIDYRNFERASYVELRAIARSARHDSPRLVPSRYLSSDN